MHEEKLIGRLSLLLVFSIFLAFAAFAIAALVLQRHSLLAPATLLGAANAATFWPFALYTRQNTPPEYRLRDGMHS